MTTFYYAPAQCIAHDPNDGHPECPERLIVIADAIAELDFLQHVSAPPATHADLLLAHSQTYLDNVFEQIPNWGLNFLDPETVVCSQSGEAALYAAGAVLAAAEAVIKGQGDNAFCAVRPPGHHAHRNHAAGFCLFNNIAIGALAALKYHGLQRVAILDFDVHHGDGTQDILWDNPDIFFASTHQWPLYNGRSTTAQERGAHGTIHNFPFPPGTDGKAVVDVWEKIILPQVSAFQPEIVFVSAGFDGHRDDPLANLGFTEADYAQLMHAIKQRAEKICNGRLVAVLEGGYNLQALSDSVVACLEVLGGK